jgi:taurine dioxygenase
MRAMAHLSVHPLSGTLGAEVRGIDLADLDDATFAALHAAWLEHQVLQIHPFLHSRKDEGHPEIVVLESDAERPFVAEGWHTDVTFSEHPPLASILRAVDVPAYGGDTMWSSCTAAYDKLSPTMQRLLGELHAVHDTSKTFSRQLYPSEKHPDAAKMPSALHPVVRTHPETGRKGLFVNPAFTDRIKGMRRAESDALLGFLYQHMVSPEMVCRFHWEPNSVAIWDNRVTQHRVVADNMTAFRRMERVTVDGERPA